MKTFTNILNLENKLPEKTPEEKIHQFSILENEADTVRDKDKILVKNLFGNFYGNQLNIGVGFQRAYGAILSGDFFELCKLPDNNYLFIFADMSGHGLPAYTSLIRLRCAITMAIMASQKEFDTFGYIDSDNLVLDISTKFTDVMEAANSNDFASIIFTFIYKNNDKFHLKFYNRGMFFPLIVRKYLKRPLDLYDLNESEKGWIPMKGHLLGSEIRKIAGPEKYNNFPFCEFIIYEGDSILFFSDGILESTKPNDRAEEYGMDRLKQKFMENINLFPQATINHIFEDVYNFIGEPQRQDDDMTAVLIDFPHLNT